MGHIMTQQEQQRDYHFDTTISREVLCNYLSRAISMQGLCESPQLDDDLRMLDNIGAKFIGRVAHTWSQHPPEQNEAHFAAAERAVSEYRKHYDDVTVFQAAIFEAVYENYVSTVAIPPWVFEAFDQPVERRCFNYEAMLYDRGRDYGEPVKWRPHAGNDWMRGYWHDGGSVPDMSKLEARMWFYYRARRYMDAGYEALHLGQIHLMDHGDPGLAHWWDLLERIRGYARTHLPRRMVLLDAHTHGAALPDGRLLFDFHSYPQHIREVAEMPEHGELAIGFRHAIYGNSKGGMTVSGWSCDALPYIVEFDNYGTSGRPGVRTGERMWVWGCDEISWFARQPEAYRNEYLRYAHHRVREMDPAGYLQMPGQRKLAEPAHGLRCYYANTRSPASPTGFNQEQTIKELWSK